MRRIEREILMSRCKETLLGAVKSKRALGWLSCSHFGALWDDPFVEDGWPWGEGVCRPGAFTDGEVVFDLTL